MLLYRSYDLRGGIKCLNERQNTLETDTNRGQANNENLLSLTDADMQALFEYKENLPSLDSTLELKGGLDTNFITHRDSSRDIDLTELNLNLEKLAKEQNNEYQNTKENNTELKS